MANVYATKNGSWSDVTVWNTGSLPASGDTVYSNNFTVQVDGTRSVVAISNAASSPIVAGGSFNLVDGADLTCSASSIGNSVTSGYLLTCSITASQSVTLRATLAGGYNNLIMTGAGVLNIVGGVKSSNDTYIALRAENGTINIAGNITQNVNTSVSMISVIGPAILNVTGHVYGSNASTNRTCDAINISSSTGVHTITGNIAGGNGASVTIIINSNCTLNITGNITGGTYGSTFAFNSSCTLNVVGTLTGASMPAIYSYNPYVLNHTGSVLASSSSPALVSSSTAAVNNLSGPLVNNGGAMAIQCVKAYLKTSSTSWKFYTSSSAERILYTADSVGGAPAAGNVRSGVTFGPAHELTGTMAVPSAAAVAAGVQVDNTVGTAVMSAADMWDAVVSGLTVPGSIGERLKNVATTDIVGSVAASLN